MSKIAEKKALEVYPILFSERNGYDNTFKDRRESYIKGYDQAMQDFLEEACEWLEPTFKRIAGYYCGGDLMNDFENYIKDESN